MTGVRFPARSRFGPPLSSGDRDNYRTALRNWEEATSAFCIALDVFMNDGTHVDGLTWILAMSRRNGDALDAARARLDFATIELDRVIAGIRNP